METSFDSDLIGEIFKRIWLRRAAERQRNEVSEATDAEVGGATPKKTRPTSANAKALKLSAELLRVFVTEAVQRSAMIAEAEGASTIEATHLERILPQLLLLHNFASGLATARLVSENCNLGIRWAQSDIADKERDHLLCYGFSLKR